MRPSHVHAKIFEAWETRETSFQAGQSRIRRGPELPCYCPRPRPRSIDAQCRREGLHAQPAEDAGVALRECQCQCMYVDIAAIGPSLHIHENRSYTSGSTLEISQGCGEVCGLLRGGPDCARRSIALRASFFSPESSCLGTVLACNPPLTGLR